MHCDFGDSRPLCPFAPDYLAQGERRVFGAAELMQRRAYSWIADSFKRFTPRIPSFARSREPINNSSNSTNGDASQSAPKATAMTPANSPWNVLQLAAIRRQQSLYCQPFWLTLPLHRCSPRKLGEVAKLIAGIKLEEAIRQVRFCPKRPAIRVYDLLCQARATIRQQVYPPFIDREGSSQAGQKDSGERRQLDSITPEIHAKANALVARYSILQAVAGKGPFLKRVEFKARGRVGIRKRPHAMIRVQFGIIDETKRVERLLRQTVAIEENKPVYCRLDY